MKIASASIFVALLGAALLGASPGACGGGTSNAAALASGNGGGGGATATSGVARATLQGFQEVPAISTAGHGTFVATRSADGTTFTFELTYADLEGNVGEGGAVTAAHIHLGQRGVAGGVAVFLCGGGGRPGCPVPPATVTGTFTAADVIGPTAQGIDAGELEELIRAARAGVTYVNVHTTRFMSGEIRGQIRYRVDGGHDGDDQEGSEHDEGDHDGDD